jgi:PAS domain S-box-containing protein
MDRQQETAVREGLKAYQGGFDISYLTDLAMPDLLERLRHLPNHTIVFFTAIGRDATGQRFISGSESARLVVAAANAPVFSFYDIHINHGEVGGDLSSLTEQGRLAGAMLLEVLHGKRPQDIPRAKGTNVYTFDWRALKRWGMGEKTLPPGSIVLNRQQIVWEEYKWYVIVGTSLILLQAFLISALLWQRTRRKKVEGELEDALAVAQESEHRFRHVANTAPVMIWMSDPDKLRTYVNQPWLDLTGRRLTEELGNGWLKSIHFEDAKTCFNNYSQAFDRRESFTMQYRVRQHGGDYRWVLDRGVPRFNADDSFAGYIGSCVDITDRKQAEEALSTVSRRLIDAQEQERTRIARELHDDISQRIALLGIDLDVLQQSLPDSAVELHSRLDEARQRASEIGSEVQAISHRLHSSKLEYLGLVAACRSFCNEVAARHRVTLDFSAEGIPSSVPPDVSLCLFRVLQEALNNTIKHSGAEHSEVELRGTLGEIQLTVRDNGVGFDGTTAVISRGLGLISMRERVSFVNGTLLIASKPTVGTEITVRAPLIQAASRAPSGAA